MDISGFPIDRIVHTARRLFASGNHANFQILGDIYPAVRAAQYLKKKGHAVEWRYDDYTNLWISGHIAEVRVTVVANSQINHIQNMMLAHGIVCVRLIATGRNPVNWMWSIVRWARERGYNMEHSLEDHLGAVKMNVILRKPHEDLAAVYMDDAVHD